MCSDYMYMLEQCYNETSAPYIAMFEDDIIFAEGWLSKTLEALAEIRQKSTQWLYLRLFYTEAFLGWDKDIDSWYTHPVFQFVLAILVAYTFAYTLRRVCRYKAPGKGRSILNIATFVTIPLFITLIFMIGRNSLIPLHGVERMDTKGCCAQALVFPRSQVPNVTAMLRERLHPRDFIIEKWANEKELARYAVAPQLVQHVGLVSSHGLKEKYTRKTFAHAFEAYDADTMKREHERLARWGIWRATDDGYELLPLS